MAILVDVDLEWPFSDTIYDYSMNILTSTEKGRQCCWLSHSAPALMISVLLAFEKRSIASALMITVVPAFEKRSMAPAHPDSPTYPTRSEAQDPGPVLCLASFELTK